MDKRFAHIKINRSLFVTGHDGEGQIRRHRQPQADPQRLPRQDQVAEGPPGCRQRRLGQAVVSVFSLYFMCLHDRYFGHVAIFFE